MPRKSRCNGKKRTFEDLKEYWLREGFPPTLTELAEKSGMDTACSYRHILNLEEEGWIVYHRPGKRSLPRPVDIGVIDLMEEQDEK